MEISELRTGEEDAWDSYVYESDASTFYHQIGWRNVVLKTYGHKPRYLVARGDDGGIIGVLPMFLMGAGCLAGNWSRFRLLRMVGCALMMLGLDARLWRRGSGWRGGRGSFS
ncbi:MAG: hypothetical protein MOIL_01377 [Candidatus Methanolliviera sp. GoM_oil]|nr:MAG: hypothetical protein MOIL_01377 [Candidatus Methanolliviera sp. GoM_oil]